MPTMPSSVYTRTISRPPAPTKGVASLGKKLFNWFTVMSVIFNVSPQEQQ